MCIKELVNRSENLQKLIRENELFVPKDYSGTIDPDMITDTGVCIRADSYGPFFPDCYFKPNQYRIVFLLKEPYVGNINDAIGHNKADELKNTEWGDLERTFKNISKMSYSLLKEKPFNNNCDVEEALNIMKQHVCIINANIFPLIATKSKTSKDEFIYKWAQKSCYRNLIIEQLQLYKPNIIIGGHTLGHFVNTVGLPQEECYLFDKNQKFSILSQSKIFDLFSLESGNYNDTYYNDNLLCINTYHPSYRDSSNLLLRIRDWWRNKGLTQNENRNQTP